MFKIANKGKEKKMTNNLSGDKSQSGGEVAVLRDGTLVMFQPQEDVSDSMSWKDLENMVSKAKLLKDEKK